MPLSPLSWLRRLALLLVLLPLLGAAPDVAVAKLKACDCIKCLKLFRLAALAQAKAYEDRMALAEKALQKEIDRWNNDAAYRASMEAEGKVLFCELHETLQDELDVVRELESKKILKQIFGDSKKCALPAGGGTDQLDCQVNLDKAKANRKGAPCPQLHLAILAHEAVHAEDCEWNQKKPFWLAESGKCNEVYKTKAPPTNEQLLDFARQNFLTERHAHEVEAEVDRLLARELKKYCKKQDLSATPAEKKPEAVKFLKQARLYDYVLRVMP